MTPPARRVNRSGKDRGSSPASPKEARGENGLDNTGISPAEKDDLRHVRERMGPTLEEEMNLSEMDAKYHAEDH
ncbi:MAG: hypothetical protein ACRDPH_16155 [Marmoricola sp.]